MSSPNDRRYLESHEWHQIQGDLVVIGVSQFAVDELTDVTFLDIKTKSGSIKAKQTIADVESVKATSEIYCGIDGQVIEYNQAAMDTPAILNQDPFGQGWLIKVKPADIKQLDALLSATDYDKLHQH